MLILYLLDIVPVLFLKIPGNNQITLNFFQFDIIHVLPPAPDLTIEKRGGGVASYLACIIKNMLLVIYGF